MSLPKEETGLSYAQQGLIDQPTLYGLQEVIREVVNSWHGFKEQDKTAKNAERLLDERVDKNAYIKAAGTAGMVKLYFKYIKEHAGDEKVKGDEAVINFLNSITKEDAQTLADSFNALLNNEGSKGLKLMSLKTAAEPFDKAMKKHLKIGKLSDSYISFLADSLTKQEAVLKQMKIKRSALTEEEINKVQLFIGELKSLEDKKVSGENTGKGIINTFSWIGFDKIEPSKNKIADFNPEDWREKQESSLSISHAKKQETLVVEIPKNIPLKKNTTGGPEFNA